MPLYSINTIFSLYDLDDIGAIKNNIEYMGNGVDLEHMISGARNHFETLNHSNVGDSNVRVSL